MEELGKKIPNMSTRRKRSSRSSIASVTSSLSDSEPSSRRSFQGLLDPPILSPSLPSLLPYHGQKSHSLRRRLTIRLLVKTLLSLVGLGLALGIILRGLHRQKQHFEISYLSHAGEDSVLVGNDTLPKDPVPVVITDKQGKTRWTVSIPDASEFPLKPSVYANICSQADGVAKHLMKLNKPHGPGRLRKRHMGYYQDDENFIDIEEAEDQGLLPNHKTKGLSWSWKSAIGQPEEDSMSEDLDTIRQDESKDKVCERSLTYVLETGNAGFGSTLMGLWMAYGLAQEEDRDFFIDDRYWAYGKYSDYFRPVPLPSCLPPPEHHRLPCPHQAQHLLVSAATTSWTFGHQFVEEYEDPRGMEVMRQVNIFALLRTGYEELFHLADSDADYVDKRVNEFDSMIRNEGGLMVGVHVRHGDRHPLEFQYQNSYIPLEHYADAAKGFISNAQPPKNGSEALSSVIASKIVLASDDPEVYNSTAFSQPLRAQEMIMLASKSHADAAQGPPSGTQFQDENLGWEGGFFKDVFWGLGSPSRSSHSLQERDELLESQRRKPPSELTMQLRTLVGRSYLLDLAVVGKADGIVCAVSSIACRLLAVMMGWEKGILQKGWRNVDGDFDWRGIVW